MFGMMLPLAASACCGRYRWRRRRLRRCPKAKTINSLDHQCGCGGVIDVQTWHYGRGIPRFIHGHHSRRGHWRVLELKQAGYLTTSDVARALGIGVTTLRRREGTIYPRAARIGGIRVYREADVELLRRRDNVPSTAAGGK